MGNFWLKNGDNSIGGSGLQGWAAFGLALVLLYVAFPPFHEFVNDLVTLLVIVILAAAALFGAGYALARRQ